jgi:putative transposase
VFAHFYWSEQNQYPSGFSACWTFARVCLKPLKFSHDIATKHCNTPHDSAAVILREADGGKSILDVCREHNISEVSFHRWKRPFGQLAVKEARRLKELERENGALKKMLAEALLKSRVLCKNSFVSSRHALRIIMVEQSVPCKKLGRVGATSAKPHMSRFRTLRSLQDNDG